MDARDAVGDGIGGFLVGENEIVAAQQFATLLVYHAAQPANLNIGFGYKIAILIDLCVERGEARKRRDFARADALRAEIDHLGWTVEDTPSGPRVAPKT